MELTPETFEKAEFIERRRGGYDIDQVETFLEETGTEFARMLVKFDRRKTDLAAANDRVGDLEKQVSDLRQKLTLTTDRLIDTEQRLESEVAARAAQPEASGSDDGGHSQQSSEEDVTNVAKALVLAQEAADKALRDARAEARAIVDGANSRSERQFAETTTKIAALVNEAKARADREYASRREAIAEELVEMEARREELAESISRMEVRIAGYRDDLRRAGEELISIAEDPAFLGGVEDGAVTEPGPSSPEDGIGGVEEDTTEKDPAEDDSDESATALERDTEEESGDESDDEPVAEADVSTDRDEDQPTDVSPDGPESVDLEEPTAEPETTTAAGEPAQDSIDVEPDADDVPKSSERSGSNGERRGPQLAQGWFDADPHTPRTEAGDGSEDEAEEEPRSDVSDKVEDLLDLRSPATPAAGDESGATTDDRGEWGPGSWSAVEKSLESRQDSSAGSGDGAKDPDPIETEASTTVNPKITRGVASRSDDDDATEAVDRVELIRDRYLEELDQAVNTELDAEDEALAAFLEGTGDSKARRFGWRR